MPELPRLDALQIPRTAAFAPRSLREAFADFDDRLRAGLFVSQTPIRLGFPELDAALGGGVRPEDFVLIGGRPNAGKTTLALQAGLQAVELQPDLLTIYVCYEHGLSTLLYRLLCMASRRDEDGVTDGTAGMGAALTRAEVEAVLLSQERRTDRQSKQLDLERLFQLLPAAECAWWRLQPCLDRLWLITADSLHTTLDHLSQYITVARHYGFSRILLVVDYAQRVPLSPALTRHGLSTEQQIDLVVRGLKALAMSHEIVVVAVAAADEAGLRQGRVHLENLWGPATVQYEPDTALIINKDEIEEHAGARRIRIAIEKSRHGQSDIEFFHELYGAQFRITPQGRLVPPNESHQLERLFDPPPMRSGHTDREAARRL